MKSGPTQHNGPSVTPRRRLRSWLLALAGCATALLVITPAALAADRALILGSSVSGGTSSIEAQRITALGLEPVVVSDATWRATTQAQFRSYRALVIGDTGGNSTATFQAATDTSATWGPVITGNTLLIGTDPVGHASQGGRQLVEQGLGFVVADSTRTGLYVTLGDAYDGASAGTPVPLLANVGPGGFTVGTAGCYNDAHIVATHPALTNLTDATLSNWSCSVHEGFDQWPGSFQVLAIARNQGSVFTASDGSVGTPYILASGNAVRSFPLSLTPTTQTLSTGSSATVTAQLLDAATRQAVPNELLGFRVQSGPNAGRTGTCAPASCRTSSAGRVTFSYRGMSKGDDVVQAWRDANANGAPDPGEPQTTTLISWRNTTLSMLVMGDSYSAGNGAGGYYGARGCQRSAYNYARWYQRLVENAPNYQRSFVENVACSGAVTRDFSGRQRPSVSFQPDVRGVPPQIEAVNDGYDIIFLTIGGNDLNFPDIVQKCLIPRHDDATDCNHLLTQAKNKLTDDTLKTSVKNVLTAIRMKANDKAKIVLLGYPYLESESDYEITSRFSRTRVKVGERVREIGRLGDKVQREIIDELNAANPTKGRSVFVETKSVFVGHELSAKFINTARWFIEPYVDESVGLFNIVYHPNWYHPDSTGWNKEAYHLYGNAQVPKRDLNSR